MHIYDFLYIVQFIVLIGITLAKLYNIFTNCKWYDLKLTWVLFIGFVLAWFTGFSIFMLEPERAIYMVLFNMARVLFLLNFLFLLVEVLINLGLIANKEMKPYEARGNNIKY